MKQRTVEQKLKTPKLVAQLKKKKMMMKKIEAPPIVNYSTTVVTNSKVVD